jgi:predicted MFS family arabinose efflux permease
LNVGLPNLMLKLAPPGAAAPSIAVYFAATSLAFGLSTILGGWLFDQLGNAAYFFPAAFLLGWLLRSAGVLWLWWLEEPKGQRHTANSR